MAQGTIKKLVSDRGFGFILPDGEPASGKDLFFHRVDVQGSGYDGLREGEQVLYDLGTDERRGTPKATNVRVLLPNS
jgi:cold shock protein